MIKFGNAKEPRSEPLPSFVKNSKNIKKSSRQQLKDFSSLLSDMESAPDVNPSNRWAGNASENNNDEPDDAPPPVPKKANVPFNPNDYFYDMSGEKLMVIFNHYEYKPTRHYNYVAPLTRTNTKEDVKNLKAVFGKLGFRVVVHEDKNAGDIWQICLSMREADYSATSCLSVVILTHGNVEGTLCAADRPYYLEHVIKLFSNHPTLVSKPKLFFIQACRGHKLDSGDKVRIDGHNDTRETFVLPTRADFLIMRSSIEGYESNRDCKGSWLIQELCKVTDEYHDRLDLLQMVTLVHRAVAYDHFTYTPETPERSDKKQMPETTFTLTRFLKF